MYVGSAQWPYVAVRGLSRMINKMLVSVWCAGMLAASTCVAGAQTQSVADFYKGKTITMIVGSDVGGGYDLTARTVARYLGRYIPGHPSVIVQNKPGASSFVASN